MNRQPGDDDVEQLVPLVAVLDALDDGAAEAARETAEALLRARTRAPPHALDAERGVIGAALIEPTVVDEAIEVGLRAEDFYRQQHGTIWAAVVDMRTAGEPVDTITVVERLRRDGTLDAVGGAAAVSQLEALIPSAAHAVSYARMVRENAQLRGVIEAARKMTEAAYRFDRAASEVVDEAERSIFALGQAATAALAFANRRGELHHILDTLGEDDPGTLATGWPEVDEVLGGGLKPGQLIVVGARPSVGKSALAHNVVARLADKHDAPSVFYSMEMPARDLLQREIAMRSGVPLRAFKNATRDQTGRIMRAAGDIETRPIHIVDRGTLHVGEIVSHARRAVSRNSVATIVVDHLQIMSGVRAEHGVGDLEAITKKLKALALDARITVILLSQLNRESEKRNDKRPSMADLRGSGGTEQDADVVVLLHRPEMALGDKCPESKRGRCELIVAKNRNGPLGVVELGYEGPTFRFIALAPDDVLSRSYDDRRAGPDA